MRIIKVFSDLHLSTHTPRFNKHREAKYCIFFLILTLVEDLVSYSTERCRVVLHILHVSFKIHSNSSHLMMWRWTASLTEVLLLHFQSNVYTIYSDLSETAECVVIVIALKCILIMVPVGHHNSVIAVA